jgi:hypothetical protein
MELRLFFPSPVLLVSRFLDMGNPLYKNPIGLLEMWVRPYLGPSLDNTSAE